MKTTPPKFIILWRRCCYCFMLFNSYGSFPLFSKWQTYITHHARSHRHYHPYACTHARVRHLCVCGWLLSSLWHTLSKNRGTACTKHQMGNIVFSSCSSKRFSFPFSLISLSRSVPARSQNELYLCCWATDFRPVWKPLFWKIGFLKAASNKTSTSTDQIRCPIFIVVAVDIAIIAHSPQMMRRGGHTKHTSDRFHLVLLPFLFA